MKLPIYQVDAFTSRLFGGNAAAVVTLGDWLPDATLQAIAAENNLSETAFVVTGRDPIPLKWFTPTVEIDLCGHATLAAGHVLFAYHLPSHTRLEFSTRSGIVSVTRDGPLLSLDFPSRPGARTAVSDALSAALGRTPQEVYRARDLMAVFETEREIRDLQPAFDRVAALDAFGVIVTAPGDDVDFVSRFFGPGAGVPEDPATGSAQCTLVPYWAARLGKPRLTARQLSRRIGEFECELRGERVSIAGRTVEYLRGEIAV